MYEKTSIEDLRMMFDNTLITYDTNPVFVCRIFKDKTAECLDIGTQDYKVLNLMDKKFDFTPVNTGYVNVRGQAIYFARQPQRKYKQGLHSESLLIMARNDSFDSADVYHSCISQVKSLMAKCLFNTVKNIYPSLQDAIASFEDKVREIAFDRQFSVTHDGLLLYRSDKVGKVNLDNAKITFGPNKAYLKNALRINYAAN